MAKSTALSRLLPQSIEVKTDDGTIRVAGNAEENKILNYLLAAQIRSLMEKTIKKYSDDEVRFTPKEMKDLADAGRSLAEFSAEVYKGNETPLKSTEKMAEAIDIGDFSKIGQEQKQDDVKTGG